MITCSSTFVTQGRTLLNNGFLILPIQPVHKRPAVTQWQSFRITERDLHKYNGYGVGILCGQGPHPIAAMDIDTSDATLARRFRDWCTRNLGFTGERVGKPPKILMPYRAAAADWRKATSAWFEDLLGERHRVEILGNGQQFVAYHIHPETGRPYEWTDLIGGLEFFRARDLPMIDEADVAAALTAFEEMALEAGLENVRGSATSPFSLTGTTEDTLLSYDPPVGLSMGDAAALLAKIDNEDYDIWLKVGMALHHEYGGSHEALDLWDSWSQSARNYSTIEVLERRWERFGCNKDRRPVTARWLLKMGKLPTKNNSLPGLKHELSEFGNTQRMLDQYGQHILYVSELDGWYLWTGTLWRTATVLELEHLAQKTIYTLPEEAEALEKEDNRKQFFKFYIGSQCVSMVTHMVRLAQSSPRVRVLVNELDQYSHLLGVANGAIDLRTGKLLSPEQAHRITIATEVAYDEQATAPLFEQTVSEVFFDNKDMISFFQRLVGYTLMGEPVEDVLVIPYGSGCNGKSTVLGAIRTALGAHAKMASADTFLSRNVHTGNAGQAREDVLRLRGARFVYVSEPDEGSELREGLIKSMTGGETMPARGIYAKKTIEVKPTWVTIMPTNHRPIVKGEDNGIWRRLMPIPFTRNFDQDPTVKKDAKRAERLAEEAPGILAWCVQGALAYQRQGLRPPATVAAAREEYKDDMDLLAEWLEECCELGDFTENVNQLWLSWESYAKARGELKYISSSRALGRRLAQRFKAKKTHGIRKYIGLRVRAIDDLL